MLNTNYTDDTGLLFGYLKGNNSSAETAKITAYLENIICIGKITSSTNISSGKWIGIMGGISGTTELHLKNIYYFSFNIPGLGAVELLGSNYSSSHIDPASSENVVIKDDTSMKAVEYGDGGGKINKEKWVLMPNIYYPCPRRVFA